MITNFCVLVAPGDVNVTVDDMAARGDNVTLTCSSKGGPNNTYQWLMNGDVMEGEDSYAFYLTSVDASSGGHYTCLVTNLAGNNTFTVMLYIEPYITEFPMTYLEVELSVSVTFTCDAEGFPTPEVIWIKVAGQTDNGNTASMTGNLTFPSVTAENNGTYVCQAVAQTREGQELQIASTEGSTLIGT